MKIAAVLLIAAVGILKAIAWQERAEAAEAQLAQIRDAKMPELPKVRTIDVMRGPGTKREENYLPAEEALAIIKSQSEQIAALQMEASKKEK